MLFKPGYSAAVSPEFYPAYTKLRSIMLGWHRWPWSFPSVSWFWLLASGGLFYFVGLGVNVLGMLFFNAPVPNYVWWVLFAVVTAVGFSAAEDNGFSSRVLFVWLSLCVAHCVMLRWLFTIHGALPFLFVFALLLTEWIFRASVLYLNCNLVLLKHIFSRGIFSHQPYHWPGRSVAFYDEKSALHWFFSFDRWSATPSDVQHEVWALLPSWKWSWANEYMVTHCNEPPAFLLNWLARDNEPVWRAFLMCHNEVVVPALSAYVEHLHNAEPLKVDSYELLDLV